MLRRISLLLIVAMLISLAAAGALSAQSNRSIFGWVVADRATIQGGGLLVTGNTVLADTEIGGDLTVTDDVVANDLTVADFANITAQGVITLTMNGTLTPTGSLQPLAAAGAVSLDGGTNIVHVTDYLVLVNVGAQTITLTETTGLISAGNIALGAGDSATLVWRGASWYQIGGSNN